MRGSWLEINLDAIASNASRLAFMADGGKGRLIAVIKANAYGHGAPAVASHLHKCLGIRDFAVATADEAVQLREAGISAIDSRVIVLGSHQRSDNASILHYGLEPTVADLDAADSLAEEWKRSQAVNWFPSYPSSTPSELHPPLNSIIASSTVNCVAGSDLSSSSLSELHRSNSSSFMTIPFSPSHSPSEHESYRSSPHGRRGNLTQWDEGRSLSHPSIFSGSQSSRSVTGHSTSWLGPSSPRSRASQTRSWYPLGSGNRSRGVLSSLFGSQIIDAPAFDRRSREAFAENVNHRHVSVHLKVDTGMNRVGVRPKDTLEAVQRLVSSGLSIAGVYTHFADSYEDEDFTSFQLDQFRAVREELLLHWPSMCPHLPLPMFSACNTGGILQMHLGTIGRDAVFDAIRPGIGLFGLHLGGNVGPDGGDMDQFSSLFHLQPALRWRARPTFVKIVHPGETVGYGRAYRPLQSETIATFSAGYADGLWRALSNRGYIRRSSDQLLCPIVGRISMDQFTVRVPFGTSTSDLFDLVTDDYSPHTSLSSRAVDLDTIPYELATSLSARLSRIYFANGERIQEHTALHRSVVNP